LFVFFLEKLKLFAVSKTFGDILGFLDKSVQSLKQTYQDDSMRNFIDHYLKKMAEVSTNETESSFKVSEIKYSRNSQ